MHQLKASVSKSYEAKEAAVNKVHGMQRTGKNSWGEDVGLGTVESKARGVKSKAK